MDHIDPVLLNVTVDSDGYDSDSDESNCDDSNNDDVNMQCGQETRVIPRLLQMRFHWLKSEKESVRLEQAGITKNVLDSAIAAFTLEIIAKHGEPAPRLCNKDPLTIKVR
ncbi:unnamed protein product [Diabrotica balteata]|uniref:Protein-tyrosine sulfotransferase n=1 Tax=Diabrotica balteata TaxID=107213 RepID=A0A9N9XD89_DIABA|nr:unnamed protein product [Diabrotica balteata]